MFFSDREISICAIILTPLANCVETACLLLLFLILDSDDGDSAVTDNDEQDEEAESSSDEEVRKQPLTYYEWCTFFHSVMVKDGIICVFLCFHIQGR